jgi:predicted dehydrogenase
MQRIVLIGSGFMARTHAAAYANIPNAQLVGVVDSNPDFAQNLSSTYGIPVYEEFDRMLEEASPDVIDICTPTPTHLEYAAKAAQAEKHVIVEKPLARTMEDCRAIADLAAKSKQKWMVAQVLRFMPQFAEGKRLVDAGTVGKPAVVRLARGWGHPGSWYGDIAQSGGILLDFMVHDWDWLLWTFGDAERVYARILNRKDVGNLDYALVTVRFKNGTIAHVAGNWAHKVQEFATEFEIAGDEGMINFNSWTSSSLRIHSSASKVDAGVTHLESPAAKEPYYLELNHFIDCIETGANPSVTPQQAMKAVQLGLAALESAQTGKLVQVDGIC